MSSSDFIIQRLSPSNLESIATFEKFAWPLHMAASREILQKRFELHHSMLGAWQGGELIGLASWRFGWLDKSDITKFPTDFQSFSGDKNAEPFNAAFVYNLGVHPQHRGKSSTTQLVYAVLEHAKQQGCDYVVGDGRCPSYQGSNDEHIVQRTHFKQSLDDIMFKHKISELEDFLQDPILNFYHRMLKCEFLWAIPNFIPDDLASGGHRVIFCKALS